MQPLSWNDLRILLAVSRAQSLAGCGGVVERQFYDNLLQDQIVRRQGRFGVAAAGHAIGRHGAAYSGAVVLNRFILHAIHSFSQANPALQISLVPDSRNLSLTRREVDLAVRFGKPQKGGNAVLVPRQNGWGRQSRFISMEHSNANSGRCATVDDQQKSPAEAAFGPTWRWAGVSPD
jgi:hypothetical protein